MLWKLLCEFVLVWKNLKKKGNKPLIAPTRNLSSNLNSSQKDLIQRLTIKLQPCELLLGWRSSTRNVQ